MTDKQKIQPSPALAAWLKNREQAIALKKYMHENGGHMMLKSTTVDPYELDELFRAEAIAYLEEQWRIEGSTSL